MPPAKKSPGKPSSRLEVKIAKGAVVQEGGRVFRAGSELRLPLPAAWRLICGGLAQPATGAADAALDVWLDSQPPEVAKAYVFHSGPRSTRSSVERERPRDSVDAFEGELAASRRHMSIAPPALLGGHS
jgi:hypothetical protein